MTVVRIALGDVRAGICGFSRGNADQLGAREGVEDRQARDEDAGESVREEAVRRAEVLAKGRVLASGQRVEASQCGSAQNDQPTTAATLISANQNSDSPKTRDEMALRVNRTVAKTKHQIQTSTPGNQRCMSKPAAVNSEPRATAQQSQYNQAVAKPVAGPMVRAA